MNRQSKPADASELMSGRRPTSLDADLPRTMELSRMSSPRIFLVRMAVFLTLAALLGVVLYRQIWLAFLANPGLNALILAVLALGIVLALIQVWRLKPEIRWINAVRHGDATLAANHKPRLLAPMAAMLGDRLGRMALPAPTVRHLLDSIAMRLDEARDISRYMIGLLVFLGLLGTFWGLIETVGSVGKVIEGLKVGGDAGSVFDALKEGLAAPLGGMGIAFSSSLFGLAGSLILGFLDLQSSQAQNRFYTELEDWLSANVAMHDGGALAGDAVDTGDLRRVVDKLRAAIEEMGSNRAATSAMANLAEAIQGLVQHVRAEQQMIRGWADQQGEQNREIKNLLELLTREAEKG